MANRDRQKNPPETQVKPADLPAPLPIPDPILARLRRAKAKTDEMHRQADAIYRHELSEAGDSVGRPGDHIVFDVESGVYLIHKEPSA